VAAGLCDLTGVVGTRKVPLAVTTAAAIVRLSRDGGVSMQRRIFASLFLVSFLIVAGGGAQSPMESEKPVWTMELIKVKADMFGFTLGYLDDNWMRVREEAKRHGSVLSYHRIAEQGSRESDRNIVLLTEYKNQAAYDASEKLFSSIRKQLPNNTSGVVRPLQQEDVYETVSERVFQDYSDIDNARFRLLSRN
jgi:hypothetical protein